MQSYNCDALGGSQEVFDENSDYFIPYIFMEWINFAKDQKFGLLKDCASFLSDKGYM